MTLNYDLTNFPGATSPPIPPNLVRQQTTTPRQQGHTLAASHAHPAHNGIAHSGHGAAHRPVQPKKRAIAHHRPNPFGEKAF